ncbi:hypothetical protein BH18THE2_BH18THE2_37920 [soil metagenome]
MSSSTKWYKEQHKGEVTSRETVAISSTEYVNDNSSSTINTGIGGIRSVEGYNTGEEREVAVSFLPEPGEEPKQRLPPLQEVMEAKGIHWTSFTETDGSGKITKQFSSPSRSRININTK